jgi:hypothetical protein
MTTKTAESKDLQGVEETGDVGALASLIDGLPAGGSYEDALPALPEVSGAEALSQLLEDVGDDEESTPARKTKTTKRRGGRSGTDPTSPPRPSVTMKKMLPTNEQVIVKKREDGKLGYIGSFSTADLSGAGSMEHFLGRYIVPKWKHGEYFLFLAKDGKEVPYGSVYMVPPDPTSSANPDKEPSLKDIIEMQERMAERTKHEASSQLDGLVKVMALLKNDESKKDSSGDLMQMMLFMQMMQPKANGPDPVVTALIGKLEKMEQQQQYSQMMMNQPLPPPPPPPPDPMVTIAPLLQGFMESQARLFEALKPAPQKERDVLGEISTITAMLKSGEGDKITLKDLPALKEMLVPKGGDDEPFDRLIKELKAIQLLKTEIIGENREPGMLEQIAGALLPALLNSSVGDRVKQAVAGAQPPAQALPPPHQGMQAVGSSGRHQEAQEDEDGGSVTIPTEWEQHAKNIADAETSAERLNAMVKGLQMLAEHQEFRPFVVNILQLASKNSKRKALKALRSLLMGLAEAEAFDGPTIPKVIEDLHIYWIPVCHAMGYRHVKDPDPAKTAPVRPQATSQRSTSAVKAAPGNGASAQEVIDVQGEEESEPDLDSEGTDNEDAIEDEESEIEEVSAN